MTWRNMICLLIVAAIFILAVYFAIRFLKKMFSPIYVHKIDNIYYVTNEKTLTPKEIEKIRSKHDKRKKRNKKK